MEEYMLGFLLIVLVGVLHILFRPRDPHDEGPDRR
jgi:hypothetical protein